mgnify:CR=1 FL=1
MNADYYDYAEPEHRAPTYAAAVADHDAWGTDAACASDRRDYVIDARHEILAPSTVAALLETCNLCPVRRECLQAALTTTTYEATGVWGGSSTLERRVYLQRQYHDSSRYDPQDPERVRRVPALVVARAARDLERSFAARLQIWRTVHEMQPEMSEEGGAA